MEREPKPSGWTLKDVTPPNKASCLFLEWGLQRGCLRSPQRLRLEEEPLREEMGSPSCRAPRKLESNSRGSPNWTLALRTFPSSPRLTFAPRPDRNATSHSFTWAEMGPFSYTPLPPPNMICGGETSPRSGHPSFTIYLDLI